jgi:hypothetical protein
LAASSADSEGPDESAATRMRWGGNRFMLQYDATEQPRAVIIP